VIEGTLDNFHRKLRCRNSETSGAAFGVTDMCRSIKTLFNFEPPATEEEIRAAALQFVRKLSGFNAPSKANQAAFDKAIEDVADVARTLISSLVTSAEPRNREVAAERARAKSAARFPPPT
jgi:hypothetical protein